jgi:hypothetical protein
LLKSGEASSLPTNVISAEVDCQRVILVFLVLLPMSLRHFEQLTRAETAQELDNSEEVAAKRYVLALKQPGLTFPATGTFFN